MLSNKEIEFKNPITKEQYHMLIKKFDLENNIFRQTNYYFDSDDFYLIGQLITLRIRHKHPKRYKLTLKTSTHQGAMEQHVFLKEDQALALIENGFNVKDFFDIDLEVKLQGTLENDRVSTLYNDGELFIDKIEYFGIVDYEIEFEVDHYETGLIVFKQFLKDNNIPMKKALRKSERVFNYKKENL